MVLTYYGIIGMILNGNILHLANIIYLLLTGEI